MEPFLRSVFCTEVVSQCWFARDAYAHLQIIGSKRAQITAETAETARMAFRDGRFSPKFEMLRQQLDHQTEQASALEGAMFRAIHSFLSHIGNVSKLFWPSDKKFGAKARGDELRRRLGVTDDHPFAKRARDHRNSLEHYDSRLDKWAETSVRRNIVSDQVGPLGANGLEKTDVMRAYDPGKAMFWFQGEELDLAELSALTDELIVKARQASEVAREEYLATIIPPVPQDALFNREHIRGGGTNE